MKILAKYIFIIITLLCFSIQAEAQSGVYSALSIDKVLMKDADEVVRLDYMNFVIENEKSAKLKVKYVVTLLNDKSNEQVQSVGYDKHSKITNLSAKIYDALGQQVRKIKGKEFLDQSAISSGTIYSDSRMKVIELNHSQYPYTIEFEYTKSFKKEPFYPSSYMQSYGKSVERFEYVVEVPEDQEIRYKGRNTDLKPKVVNEGGKKVYTWTAESLPALKYEPFAPYHDKIIPAILIAPTAFQYDKYKGDMSSWESFGRFIYELNEGRDELSPKMAQKVKELVADAKDEREKIEILYRYLQNNMRYVSVQLGIGGWQTFDAKYVEENKYGDCKALSNFMMSILKEAGITSYQTLIYNDRRNKVDMDDTFTFPNFANHVILNVPSQDMWLECTSTDYPPDYIGSGNQNRPVLMLSKEGGKIIKTPTYGLEDNKEINIASITIDEKGAAVIQKQTTYIGPKHEYYRYASNNYSKEDFEKAFLKNLDLPAFTIDKLEVRNDEDKPRSVLDFHLSVPRYSSQAGKRIFIPINKLNTFSGVPKVIEKRIHPVHVKEEYKEEDQYTFQLPDGFEIESIPQESINLESEFGKYQVDIKVDGQTLSYTRLLEIYSVELPAERYNDLRNFYKEIAKADGMKIVLVKRKT